MRQTELSDVVNTRTCMSQSPPFACIRCCYCIGLLHTKLQHVRCCAWTGMFLQFTDRTNKKRTTSACCMGHQPVRQLVQV